MINSIVRFFWPSLKDDEIKKFSLLSATFFFTIGGYWMLRLLKDTVFFKIAFPESLGWAAGQGALFQPVAKMLSVVVVIAMVIIYSKLVDLFQKHQLFYIVAGFYASIFAVITSLLVMREFYGDLFLGKNLLAGMGWVTYFGIESFGSIMVPVFWSFTISVTDSESAKVGFPLILAGAQIGSIGGSALLIVSSQFGRIWPLFLLATFFLIMITVLINHFMKTIPQHQVGPAEEKEKKVKPGFIEGFLGGLRLIVTRPYIFGILIVSTFYEVIGTIIDYQMKRQASVFPEYASEVGFAKFMGIFGVCTNGLAFLMALLGTSYMMKRYGLRFCLLLYPVCVGIALIGLYAFYAQGPTAASLLWVTFSVMMVVKGLSYAVNNPTKEMMYIPTSKDAKFKAKGWVDMFGARTAKMGGSQVTNLFKHNLGSLMMYGTIFGLGVLVFWIIAAIFVGNKNKQLVSEGKVVE